MLLVIGSFEQDGKHYTKYREIFLDGASRELTEKECVKIHEKWIYEKERVAADIIKKVCPEFWIDELIDE